MREIEARDKARPRGPPLEKSRGAPVRRGRDSRGSEESLARRSGSGRVRYNHAVMLSRHPLPPAGRTRRLAAAADSDGQMYILPSIK